MKKKNVLFCCLLAVLSLSITACDFLPNLMPNKNNSSQKRQDDDDDEEGNSSIKKSSQDEYSSDGRHVHSFDTSVWEYDDNQHWHPATCGHSLKGDAARHQLESYTIQDATCQEEGVKVEYCLVCSYKKTAPIEKLGHSWVEIYRSEATCETAGFVRYRCAICAETTEYVLEALGHDYQRVEGTNIERCSRCGNEKNISSSTCTEHEWGALTYVEPSNGALNGYYLRDCINNDATRLEIQAIEGQIQNGSLKAGTIDGYMKLNSNGSSISYSFFFEGEAVGMLYQRAYMDAWSSNQGRTYSSISGGTESPEGNFSVRFNGATVDMSPYMQIPYAEMLSNGEDLGMGGGNYSPVADCPIGTVYLTSGINTLEFTRLSAYNLSIDKFAIVFNKVDASSHQHNPSMWWEYDANSHWHTCVSQDCPLGSNGKLDYSDHVFGEYTIVTEPTCSTIGSKRRVCAVCGYADYINIPNTDHTPLGSTFMEREPTCTQEGSQYQYCSVCGERVYESIPALGHTWNNGEVMTPPTHTDPGTMIYTCLVCGETRLEAIPGGHQWGATTIVTASEGQVNYELQRCLEDGAYKIDIKTVDGTLENGSSFKFGAFEGFVRLSNNNGMVSYSFEFPVNAFGTIYQRGYIDNYPSSAGYTYQKGAQSGAPYNFTVSVNNTEVDMTESGNITYREFFEGGTVYDSNSNYSPVADCLIGDVELLPGLNTITYRRNGSYSPYISDLILVVEEASHTHSLTENYLYDDEYHWKTCVDPYCPISSNQFNKTPHTYGEPVMIQGGACEEIATYEYTCTECGYKKTEKVTLDHQLEGGYYVTNSAGQRVEMLVCTVCNKVFHSMDFRDTCSNPSLVDSTYRLSAQTSISWKMPVFQSGWIDIQLPLSLNSSTQTTPILYGERYIIKVNGVTQPSKLPESITYEEFGLTTTPKYYTFAQYYVTEDDVLRDEIEIELVHNNDTYRLRFQGNLRISYNP